MNLLSLFALCDLLLGVFGFLSRPPLSRPLGVSPSAAEVLNFSLEQVARHQTRLAQTEKEGGGSGIRDGADSKRQSVCCPSTRVPALEDPSKYEKKGKIEEIEGVKAYIVGEPSKNAIFVIADVFGYDSGRHFGIADQLADEGYYVVMPDLFEGDRMTFADLGTPRLGEFIMKFKPNVWQPLADKIYAHLAAKGAQKIGAIGFCWGCWAIFHESSRGKLACGVNCHPSLRIEEMMDGDVEALTEQRGGAQGREEEARHNMCVFREGCPTVQAPMLMFPCQDDPENTQPDGSVMKILKGKKFGDACDCFRFGEQNHGFVSQGDLSVPATARDVEEAMKRTVAFFKGTLPVYKPV